MILNSVFSVQIVRCRIGIFAHLFFPIDSIATKFYSPVEIFVLFLILYFHLLPFGWDSKTLLKTSVISDGKTLFP